MDQADRNSSTVAASGCATREALSNCDQTKTKESFARASTNMVRPSMVEEGS